MKRTFDVCCAVILSWFACVAPLRAQGFWQEAPPLSTASKPIAVAIGDLDQDGHLDLVIAGQNPGVPGVLSIRWGGPYGFSSTDTCQQPFSYFGRVYVQDLNADGWPEIVVADSSSTTATVYVNTGLQAGSCRVGFTPTTAPPSYGIDLVRFADVDADGKLDLVTAGGGAHELVYQPQTPASPVGGIPQFGAPVNVSQAAGANAQPPQASIGYGFAKGLGVGDFDGDGTVDIAVAAGSAAGAGILIYYNRPSGWAYQSLYSGSAALGIAVGDFNGDSLTDFVASFGNFGVVTFLNAGPPSGGVYAGVVAVPSTGVGAQGFSLSSGDFNGDGSPDIAYGDPATGTVAIDYNPGTGIFDFGGEHHYSINAGTLAVGDIDGDGDLDFVSALFTAYSIRSLFNEANANARKPVHAQRLRGGALNIALADLDAPDGAQLSQASSGTPLSTVLGGYLWADAFTFQTQGASGSQVRIRINDSSLSGNGSARIGLVDVATRKLAWVGQYTLQSTLTNTLLDVPNANQFGAVQGQIELVLLHANAQGSFQSSVDQLSLELIP